jgi:hypothetical protein
MTISAKAIIKHIEGLPESFTRDQVIDRAFEVSRKKDKKKRARTRISRALMKP